MEGPPRMTAQPLDHLRVLVGGVVAEDDVDGLADRGLRTPSCKGRDVRKWRC